MATKREARPQCPEGEGWINARQVARILGVTLAAVHTPSVAARLTATRVGKSDWYRVEAVEALARSAKRRRKQVNADRRAAGRKVGSLEGSSVCRIDGKEAAWRLGMSARGLLTLLDSGKLTLYKEARSCKFWYSWAEVEELRAARAAAGAKEARFAQWDGPQIEAEATGRRRRNRKSGSGRVLSSDLDEWERYLGEWLTARQTAFLLNTSESTVWKLRQNGRLRGERRSGDYGKRRQWQFRKRDVEALLDDKGYMERRMHWEQKLSLAARQRRQAAAERASLQSCMEANRRHAEQNSLCVRWLEVRW